MCANRSSINISDQIICRLISFSKIIVAIEGFKALIDPKRCRDRWRVDSTSWTLKRWKNCFFFGFQDGQAKKNFENFAPEMSRKVFSLLKSIWSKIFDHFWRRKDAVNRLLRTCCQNERWKVEVMSVCVCVGPHQRWVDLLIELDHEQGKRDWSWPDQTAAFTVVEAVCVRESERRKATNIHKLKKRSVWDCARMDQECRLCVCGACAVW